MKHRNETLQVDMSKLLNDLDTLRVRIEYLENSFAVEIRSKQSKLVRKSTFIRIFTDAMSEIKKWTRNRTVNLRTPQ
jgi:nitrate reductase beta subunit